MFVICGVEGITSGMPHVIVPQFSPQFPAWARFGVNRTMHTQHFTRRFEFSMSGLRFTGCRYPAGAMQAVSTLELPLLQFNPPVEDREQ